MAGFSPTSTGFSDALVMLGAAGIVITTFARFKVNPVIGFILVGLALGPHGLGYFTPHWPWLYHVTISDPHAIEPFAEFGIILLLFAIGLELSFKRLWQMRAKVFGDGAAELLVSAALMLGLPHFIASLYTHDPKVIALAVQLIVLAGLFQFSDGIQVASNGALRGLKDTRVPMAITLFAYWMIGMPLGWWLTFKQGMGARGMWMGLIAGLSVAAVLLFTRFWRSAWRDRWRRAAVTEPVLPATLGL